MLLEVGDGSRGGGEKVSPFSVSWSKMAVKDSGESHGGGTTLARRWRFSSRACQRGTEALCGGMRGFNGPYHQSDIGRVYCNAQGSRCRRPNRVSGVVHIPPAMRALRAFGAV